MGENVAGVLASPGPNAQSSDRFKEKMFRRMVSHYEETMKKLWIARDIS